MSNGGELFIKFIYKLWKKDSIPLDNYHPNDDDLTCFIEGKLGKAESRKIKEHLLSCDSCMEVFALQVKAEFTEINCIPQDLIQQAKKIFINKKILPVLDLVIKIKDETLELLQGSGDILVGQEFLPVPVLRSRSIKEFKDGILIVKDFAEITVEVKIEHRGHEFFNMNALAKNKNTQQQLRNLRFTLLNNGIELESHVAGSGAVRFEHVRIGKYVVEVSGVDEKMALISIEIKT